MSRVKKVLIIAPSIKNESKEVAKEIEEYLSTQKISLTSIYIDSTEETVPYYMQPALQLHTAQQYYL